MEIENEATTPATAIARTASTTQVYHPSGVMNIGEMIAQAW